MNIINCFTVTVEHAESAEDTNVYRYDGIQVFDYFFRNGGEAKMVHVGGRTAANGEKRTQLRVADTVLPFLVEGKRSKSVDDEGTREDRDVNLMVEAQYIEYRDQKSGDVRKFFGKSENWSRRAPADTDPANWMDNMPTEAYVMILGQHQRVRVEGGAVLEEGYTEKYGEIFGVVQLVRIRLGEVAKLIVEGEDGSEAIYNLTYDMKSLNAERC